MISGTLALKWCCDLPLMGGVVVPVEIEKKLLGMLRWEIEHSNIFILKLSLLKNEIQSD